MIRRHKRKIVNLARVVYIPMIISITFILVMSIVSINLNSEKLLTQYREEGVTVANQVGGQLTKNIESQKYAEAILEEKIEIAGRTVLKMEQTSQISNKLLYELMNILDVSELHYMDKDGQILYSTIEGYLGWIPHEQHPLYAFVRTDVQQLMEEIRPDDKYNKLMKYGAIKSSKGSFVQVGLEAEIVEYAKAQFSYQSVIDEVASHSKVLGIRFLDLNLKTIAYSSDAYMTKEAKVNIDTFSKQEDILIMKTYTSEGNLAGYEFYIPIFSGDTMFGVLNIDYSLEEFVEYDEMVVWFNIVFIIFLIMILTGFQYYNIIRPIHDLEESIDKIDVASNTLYKLPQEGKKSFLGLIDIINKILDKTYGYIFELNETKEELVGSNEELMATYQQIRAAEETLREQFDEIVNQKQYIEYIAYHDELTGLANRQGFVRWLNEKLTTEKQGSVLLIGIDNFKGINNTLGHEFGDKVLKCVAEMLKTLSTKAYIARFSGDEFIVYLSDLDDISEIDQFVSTVMTTLKRDVEVEDKKIYITTSIGISLYPNDSREVNKLIIDADSAVSKVKEKGKNGYLYFNEEMIELIMEKSKIETLLREAFDKDQFKLVYQPQVSLVTGQVVGLEALLRLKNKACKPDTFIPIAEEIGLILPIGRWVAKTVVEQLALWKKQGFEIRKTAINFSPIQLRDKQFHTYLASLLLDYEIPATYIEIEVTENILIENMSEALNYLNEFKALDINLALDDFGTGFSSISYLESLPIDKVKLDKDLMWKYSSDDERVIKALIELSKCFDLEVVAEGIEDEIMKTKFKQSGGHIVQGYYYSKPIDGDEVYEVIEQIEKN